MRFKIGARVRHDDRPAVVITDGVVGANGRVLYGIRYTDVPRFVEDAYGMRPNGGALAYEDDLSLDR
jgi:hypothetical protein